MKSILVNGKKISYIDKGVGELLLLLHGWPTCKEVLLSLVNELKDKFRLVVPDLPGFGDSEAFEDYADLNFYADFIKDFIDELDLDKVNIFGNSLGGGLALLMGVKYPAKVESLIVMAPMFYYKQLPRIFSGKLSRRFWEYISRFSLSRKMLGYLVYRIYFRIMYPQEMKKGKSYSQEEMGILQIVISKFKSLENFKPIRDVAIACLKVDFRPILKKLSKPVLILWNSNEKLLSPKWGNVLHQLLRKSSLSIIDDSPHSILAADEEITARKICNFLSKSDKISLL